MTDFSDADASDNALADLVAEVRGQAAEIVTLDGPRAEAWASDVLALAAELESSPDGDDPIRRLLDELRAIDDDDSVAARCAIGGLVTDDEELRWHGDPPEWASAIGTSRCEGAWLLRARGAISVAFRFVDAADVRHVLTVDLLPGAPETIGEVAVGPGDLLDALDEEDADVVVESDATPGALATRVATALGSTARPRESAVVNGRLLVTRLATLTDESCAPPIGVPDDVPDPPERDPEDDAYALEILERALGVIPDSSGPAGVADEAVAVVVEAVAPLDMGPLAPPVRDAVLTLEWADWLGAVIGLVRAGVGTDVDGDALVDFINRCPEVTSTIPKADRNRIVWAFDTLITPWEEAGILADGCLADGGLAVLPAALREAWAPASPTAVDDDSAQ